jgi:hypothetical protein
MKSGKTIHPGFLRQLLSNPLNLGLIRFSVNGFIDLLHLLSSISMVFRSCSWIPEILDEPRETIHPGFLRQFFSDSLHY